MHWDAPVLPSVEVPSPHSAHASRVYAPLCETYLPTGHSMHTTCVAVTLYLPVSQAVQVEAPTPVPLLVMEPAGHTVHAERAEVGE